MKIGKYKIDFITTGHWLIDGGAMFGAAPKAWWEKKIPPDANNCILLKIRSMLVRRKGKAVLVNAGPGEDRDDKYYRGRGIQRSEMGLIKSLAGLGVRAKDITHLICTDLMLTNNGGITKSGGSKTHKRAFPNAKTFIQEAEFKRINDVVFGSETFFNLPQIKATQSLTGAKKTKGDTEIIPGISVAHSGCITGGDQIVTIETKNEKLAFMGCLIPTMSHLIPNVIQGMATYPLQAIKAKRKLIAYLHKNKFMIAFQNDPTCIAGILQKSSKGWTVKPLQSEALERVFL